MVRRKELLTLTVMELRIMFIKHNGSWIDSENQQYLELLYGTCTILTMENYQDMYALAKVMNQELTHGKKLMQKTQLLPKQKLNKRN